MLYFLHGSDTYRSRRKLNEIISQYREKAGVDFQRLDLEETESTEIVNFLESQSLFTFRKLVVAENISQCQNIKILETALGKFRDSKDTIIILWDREIGSAEMAKLRGIEKLAVKTQEFKNLSGAQLKSWIKEEAAGLGFSPSPEQLEKLERLGSDLWLLANELEKMFLLKSGEAGISKEITEEKIVFRLGDLFFSSPREAIRVLLKALNQGEDESRLFAYLAGQNRTLLIAKFYAEKGRPVPAEYKIHPFVERKAEQLSRGLSADYLKNCLRGFFAEDRKIKIGLTSPKEALLNMLQNCHPEGVPVYRDDRRIS